MAATRTRLTNNAADEGSAPWSPDGTKLAFTSNRDGNYEVYVMNADGSSQTRLTNTTSADVAPQWAPNGTQILFVSNRDGNYEIYRLNSDLSTNRLTNNAAADGYDSVTVGGVINPYYGLSPSPDGAWIVFMSTRDGNYELYRMDSSGGNISRLTNNAATDQFGAWR